MDRQSDNELIEAYRRGREDALDTLIRRHLAAVHRFLRRLTGEAAVADDLTQETFVKAWRKLHQFNPAKSFKPWLMTIARNAAFDYFRKQKPVVFSEMENDDLPDMAESVADERPLPDEILARRDVAERLEQALGSLPPKARSVVLLHETEDLTFQEIAEATGEPMNTVKSRYRRALGVLRKLLTDHS